MGKIEKGIYAVIVFSLIVTTFMSAAFFSKDFYGKELDETSQKIFSDSNETVFEELAHAEDFQSDTEKSDEASDQITTKSMLKAITTYPFKSLESAMTLMSSVAGYVGIPKYMITGALTILILFFAYGVYYLLNKYKS